MLEFGYAGHKLPILINYMHSAHIDILRENPINPTHKTYSPTYASVETDDMHHY